MKKINKKSQAWGIDLMAAAFIFSIGIISFYIYALNYSGNSEGITELLQYDGKIVTDIIFSEGFPKSWTTDNVISTGILTDNKINETKLENFYNLASADYQKTKSLFNTKYDYYFFLDEPMQINSVEVLGIGKPGATPENIADSAENLIKITRFTAYEDKPTTAYLYIWEE